MDFALDDEQRDLADALDTLLSRHAGPERAQDLLRRETSDTDVMKRLDEGGFLNAGPGGVCSLERALLVEAASRHAALAPVAARALVAAEVLPGDLPLNIALAWAGPDAPVRFGAQADLVMSIEGDTTRVFRPESVVSVGGTRQEGYPLGRVSGPTVAELDAETTARVRAWWQVAIATELAGCLDAVLTKSVSYVRERTQFGKPLASKQAVQHRLAETAIGLEGSRWLARRAAFAKAPAELAAAATAYACRAAGNAFMHVHQVHGAIGITDEYRLTVWTVRMMMLRRELGGVTAHERALGMARYVH
ncbi:MAG TPA: acyl-CoA dehydrogenase family protein [Amycolatopsis sp.]|nr:acyl-CoA dehydrogenase family protein [Amycolatopsis sp.]